MNTPFSSVIDCHAHLSKRDLAQGGRGLDQILSRCERYRVKGIVYCLFFENGRLELPLEEIERVSATRSVAVGIAFGICPPMEAMAASAQNALVSEAAALARQLASAGRILAVGEVGLDYYWPLVEYLGKQGVRDQNEVQTRLVEQREDLLKAAPVRACVETQAAVFRGSIRLAVELDLPLVVHGRDAYADILDILQASEIAPERVMLHCFAGSPAQAIRFAEAGFTISIPSSVEYRPAFSAVADVVDLSQIVIETDSPYHSPFLGLWKDAGRQMRKCEFPSDQQKVGKQAWKRQKQHECFMQHVEARYPGLEFGAPAEGHARSVPAEKHLSRKSARKLNEPTFVRCAATGLAQIKGVDVKTVCEVTSQNAQRIFRGLAVR